ncbi:hypothetical protein DENSPDRAFT_931300 [Dentipellis sp. KUC8613]|nr:hypothetical protein DENSPDRAFT_931300 [Dentipellis sp. KUC8613]
MDSIDSGMPSGSRLLSESPGFASFPSSSSIPSTGPGGDDLSLSELSLTDRRSKQKPFSLLAQPTDNHDSVDVDENDNAEEDEGKELAGGVEDEEAKERLAARMREEKLQNDLFVLKKLNAAFNVYNKALAETESATDRVAAQLEHTDALLNKYVSILAKSEQATRLIFDERWHGAEADEEVLEKEEREEAERRRKEEEEKALAAQREQERREREEMERQAKEEKERLDREKKEKMASRSTSGVRGVRGTRASMRASATRGVTRGAPAASSTSHMRASSANSSGSGVSRIARPSASSRATTTSRGVSRRT